MPARPTRAGELLPLAEAQARIAIVDDGHGFDPAGSRRHRAKVSACGAMRERAEAVGGSLR